MGVRGAWEFLAKRNINGIERKNLQSFKCNEKIYVEVTGTFFRILRDHFWLCDETDVEKLTVATKGVLAEISTIINRSDYVLCFDGHRTVEREKGLELHLNLQLKTQDKLWKALGEFRDKKVKKKSDCNNLLCLSKRLFRISETLERFFADKCREDGWDVYEGIGEAEVAIGLMDGVVVTQDSDMLFYPRVIAVIKPLNEGGYALYRKDEILQKLGITDAAWTALGILADNDYDIDQFTNDNFYNPEAYVRGIYGTQFENNYNEMNSCLSTIHSSRCAVTLAGFIREHLEAFIFFMNKKKGKSVQFNAYRNSYRIFVLQKEEPVRSKHALNRLLSIRPQEVVKVIMDSDSKWKPVY
ncbi:MAG: hypothetical protein EXX96DRAFT_629778 [Benjaminiella poitrasii]|nr:MAG: hypothetical protein EXX96DRAFT_629778 [Benjaminiella poitrasii]